MIVVPFYNFDIYGMLHCVTRFDFQRYVVKLLETFIKLGREKSIVYGPKARQLVVLFDVADFNLKQYVWRPAAELIIAMIKQYEQNYPEILKICYIINSKFFFFWMCVKIFSKILSFEYDFFSAKNIFRCL